MRNNFPKNQEGSVAILAGIALFALIGIVGSAVDLGRASLVRAKLQAALDSAALAGASMPKTAKEEEITKQVQNYFRANFPEGYLGSRDNGIDPTYEVKNGIVSKITLKGTAQISNVFMPILNEPNTELATTSVVNRNFSAVELVMVLDTTGSMKANNKIGGLVSAANALVDEIMPEGANNSDTFVSIVPFSSDVNVGNDTFKRDNWLKQYGKVCFGTDPCPNKGEDMITWTHWNYSNYGGPSVPYKYGTPDSFVRWIDNKDPRKGAVCEDPDSPANINKPLRTAGSSSASRQRFNACRNEKDPPAKSAGVTQAYALNGQYTNAAGQKRWKPTEVQDTDWQGCVTKRVFPPDIPNDGTNAEGIQLNETARFGTIDKRPDFSNQDTLFPPLFPWGNGPLNYNPQNLGGYCPQPITPLTNDRNLVKAKIEALRNNTGGNTRTNMGILWGFRSISPNWKGLWGNNDLPQSYADATQKVVVLMTDGINAWGAHDPNGKLISWNGAGSGGGDDGTTTTPTTGTGVRIEDPNADTVRVCNAMKAQSSGSREGIRIYTVLFGLDFRSPADKDRIKAVFKNCATKPEYFFEVATNDELTKAFRDIGSSLSGVKLAK